MSLSNPKTMYDSTNWSVEIADPSTGQWTDVFIHDTCKAEYSRGTELASDLTVLKNKPGYAKEHFTVTCLDCGIKHRFSGETYIGED